MAIENELHVVARHAASAPVNLAGMFADLGIAYREESIWTGESGWIERVGEDFGVVVDADDPEPRKRFTAAHELAHYLLHRDLMQDGGRMNRHTDHLFGVAPAGQKSAIGRHHEVQANRLAAQILMPASLVRVEHAKGLSAAALAEKFRVSQAAMDIRLKTLGLV